MIKCRRCGCVFPANQRDASAGDGSVIPVTGVSIGRVIPNIDNEIGSYNERGTMIVETVILQKWTRRR